MQTRQAYFAVIIIAILAVSAGVYWITSPKSIHSVSISLPATSVPFIPFIVAEEKGFFEGEGLDANLVAVRGGPAAVQSLISGEVEFTTALSSTVAAFLKGADVKIVAGFWAKMPQYDIMARPDVGVRTVSDLKGKTIGVTRQGNLDDYMLRAILAKNGLDPDKDVTLLYHGGRTDDNPKMLENGAIDAGMVGPPISVVYSMQKGYVIIAKGRDYIPKYATGGLVTTSKMIEEKPEVVKKMVKALAKTIDYIHQNKDETVQTYIGQYPTLLDIRTAEEMYDQYRDFYDITVEPEAVEVTLNLEAKAMGLTDYPTVDKLLDLSFVNEVERELSQ